MAMDRTAKFSLAIRITGILNIVYGFGYLISSLSALGSGSPYSGVVLVTCWIFFAIAIPGFVGAFLDISCCNCNRRSSYIASMIFDALGIGVLLGTMAQIAGVIQLLMYYHECQDTFNGNGYHSVCIDSSSVVPAAFIILTTVLGFFSLLVHLVLVSLMQHYIKDGQGPTMAGPLMINMQGEGFQPQIGYTPPPYGRLPPDV